jgi:hypothetical protein
MSQQLGGESPNLFPNEGVMDHGDLFDESS